MNAADGVELCLEDPAQVDLFLATTLRDMIRLVRGDITIAQALDSGRL